MRKKKRPESIDMLGTCFHTSCMSTMIQIRNVPDALHATLKARAALAGRSLTDFLLAELRRVAELPTEQELAARLRGRRQPTLRTPPSKAIRAERDRR
jgi:plasmid stability protein